MRVEVWCATAFALIVAIAGSALRPSQPEGVTRVGRRLSARDENVSITSSMKPEQIDHTSIRPKSSIRREQYSERDANRSRSRSKPQETASSTPGIDTQVKSQTERNERFSSRRTYSRTRNRTNNESIKTVQTTPLNSYTVRSRTRQGSRKAPTPRPALVSPNVDESKIEVINSNLEHITKSYESPSTAQFRRRSSTSFAPYTEFPKRNRSKINTKVEIPSSAPDLDSSGSTNDISVTLKEPTTARSSKVVEDIRSSRKLRYKTRLSETETNLTGEGLKSVSNEDKSSQNKEINPSQIEFQTPSVSVADTTENVIKPTITAKNMKVVRRPLKRGSANFRPTIVSLSKKSDDEVSDDDNYPESFKALLQAKNASTHSNSHSSESLSVKASQIVYNTFSLPSQSLNTETEKSQTNLRYRNKLNNEDKNSTDEITTQNIKKDMKIDNDFNLTKSTEKIYNNKPEFKPRPTYTPRNRKNSLFTSATSNNSQISSTKKTPYKFDRKFKLTTESLDTETAKGIQMNSSPNKYLARPSYYSRQRNSNRSNASTVSNVPIDTTRKENNVSSTIKPSYRTSYYSRLRSSRNNTTESPKAENLFVEKKKDKAFENSASFTTITSLENDNNLDIKPGNKNKEDFVIAVTSKESQEQSTENEMNTMNTENNNIDVTHYIPTTSKYHSSYKNINAVSEDSIEEIMMTSLPPIRNILPRKFGRARKVEKKTNEDFDSSTSLTTNETNLKKISESYSKSSTPSTNGITQDIEKTKNRFSSKYRISYFDKPFYKATVPTITPSTAWLKFFVTDRELIKTIQDPDWFIDDPFYEATTDSMPRQHYIQTSPFTHESPIELVEGEENQLGPDMNSISFTQTRRTLSSADLRLSESVVKSSHVMNVEASNHSPSVTVSIFDALADILTSTPRPRLSSTTEVAPKTDKIIDVKQTLKGVSNSINSVNSSRFLVSQDAMIDDITTDTKIVQNTDPTTQSNVNNRMLVEESVSPSLNEEQNEPSSTLPSTFTPNPTFTILHSIRRPFAIKVLYTATEFPSDTTSSTTISSSSDNPTMVLNKESDILVSNNNLVSSELTSMLSNNINDILKNMDYNTRSKVSANMATLLRNLIPRAVNGLLSANNKVDVIPETTPYTLEAIRDTEVNINFNSSETILSDSIPIQNVSNVNLVNMTVDKPDFLRVDTKPSIDHPLDNFEKSVPAKSNSVSEFKSQRLIEDVTLDDIATTESNIETSTVMISKAIFSTSSDSLNTDADFVNSKMTSVFLEPNTDTTNIIPKIPVPFFTNSKISDFTLGELVNIDNVDTTTVKTKSSPLISLTSDINSLNTQEDLDNIDTSDPSKVSPLQLLVLSKKARVLKMIEDLIKQHHYELSLPLSLSETINKPMSVTIAERLTAIMNNMNTTTTVDVSNFNDMISNIMTTTPMTTLSPTYPLSPISSSTQVLTTTESDNSPTSTMSSSDISVTLDLNSRSILENTSTESATALVDFTTSTSPLTDSNSVTIETLVDQTIPLETTTSRLATTLSNAETTEINSKITTQNDNEITTQNNVDSTTQTDTETTSMQPIHENQQNTTASTNNTSLFNTEIQSTPPKKDYVIFGILPNNTVVRKDPNDDVLETLTEASPYIIYGVLPNNTIIRKFPNGTRVPRIMQKIDVLPISPWSLRNPYSPIHNNPAIVRPQYNPIRASTNVMTSADSSNNEAENTLTTVTVNNQQIMISSSALDIKDSRMLGIVTTTNKSPAEKSTASHVLSLRTTTMLPSVDEILLNSISSAAKEELVKSSMTSSTSEPRILTLDIDPETKQIRTEKPGNENMNAVFKFIPIEDVPMQSHNSNVLKLATKSAITTDHTEKTEATVTETNLQTFQIQMSTNTDNEPTTTVLVNVGTPLEATTEMPSPIYVRSTEENQFSTLTTTESITDVPTTSEPTTISAPITITTTEMPQILTTTTTTEAQQKAEITTEPIISILTTEVTDQLLTTVLPTTTINIDEESQKIQENALLLQNLLTGRSAQNYNTLVNSNGITTQNLITTALPTTVKANMVSDNESEKLLQALLLATGQNSETPSIGSRQGNPSATLTTTPRSIEEEIKQFEKDTQLLKALLQATGQNPSKFNIPTLNTKVTQIPTSTPIPTTTSKKPSTTTPSIEEDIKKFQEDAKLLQVLVQATGQNPKDFNLPLISSVTSNVRMSSKPIITTIQSTPMTTESFPVSTSEMTTQFPTSTTLDVSSIITTFQPKETTENNKISTTYPPFINQRRRIPPPTVNPESTTGRSFQSTSRTNGRQSTGRFILTTELPTSSTFSVDEDVAFLNNLKSVLNTNNIEDPETSLANRIIALAVEKSLNEITTNKNTESVRDGKAIANGFDYRITTTTAKPLTTTTTSTTTTPRPTTMSTPSIEEDIKQFQEDTKLLQALLKATGQDPSKFKIPIIPDAPTNVRLIPTNSPKPQDDLKLLTNLLASPSPLTDSFKSVNSKPIKQQKFAQTYTTKSPRPYGAKIAVEDKPVQDEATLIKTLIKLQGVGETTTQKPKLTLTGQTPDQALKLLQRTKQTGSMISQATQAPMSLSTEYGKSQDALLAALLKEQGFGPTTASSLDEQVRLAALLNQVVVTPKARRTTTTPPPPPPPAPRRPIIDGLAWLWQQWRETAPGPGGARPNRRPAPAPSMASSAQTSSRVNWFGSGPFVGNAADRPAASANRVPLEPPAVVAEQAPSRGQLVSAAINVTRAFSQFLGAALQGAAQTVQSVIRAGQRAASDAYVNGSG